MVLRSEARRLGQFLHRRNKVIVFTNGCFDLLHAGHVRYLRKARAMGDVLIVGVNTDGSVRRLKGPTRPWMKLAHRLEMLSALEMVDHLIAFGQDTPAQLIESLRADVLVKGADYKINAIAGSDFVRGQGGKVKRIPLAAGLSTSALIKKIRSDRARLSS